MAVLFHRRAEKQPELHGRPLSEPHRADGYDVEEVRAAFEEFLSHRLFFANDVRVHDLSRVSGPGMSNVTFRAGVSWSGPGDPSADVVLRLPDRDAPAHDRSSASIERRRSCGRRACRFPRPHGRVSTIRS